LDGKPGYDNNRHYASFMGFFPADKPQYGMLFMLDEPQGSGLSGGDVAAPMFKKIGDGILRYCVNDPGIGQEAEQKLSLRDWPASENDEAVVHVEMGRVPDVCGLSLKSAVHRILLAGGRPKIEGLASTPTGAFRIIEQSPEAGANLDPGAVVKIRMKGP
jgi:hypothetical protein